MKKIAEAKITKRCLNCGVTLELEQHDIEFRGVLSTINPPPDSAARCYGSKCPECGMDIIIFDSELPQVWKEPYQKIYQGPQWWS